MAVPYRSHQIPIATEVLLALPKSARATNQTLAFLNGYVREDEAALEALLHTPEFKAGIDQQNIELGAIEALSTEGPMSGHALSLPFAVPIIGDPKLRKSGEIAELAWLPLESARAVLSSAASTKTGRSKVVFQHFFRFVTSCAPDNPQL